jgi:CysZ protein
MPSALIRALFSLMHARMLLLMIWPVLLALAIWLVVAAAFWSEARQWINEWLAPTDLVQWMLQFGVLAFIAAHLSTIVLAIAFIPLVLVTAVLIIGVFAMPAMVSHVASRDYPQLERRRGGTLMGSVWNSLLALIIFIVLAVATLPLWLLPFLWPVLPVLLFAYLNQRVFRYDALAEHASREEMARIVRRHRSDFLLLGVAVAVLGHVPVLGFFAPVYGGLAFIHYGLDRLQRLRGGPIP